MDHRTQMADILELLSRDKVIPTQPIFMELRSRDNVLSVLLSLNEDSMFHLGANGDIDAIRRRLAAHKDINERDISGQTALFGASWGNRYRTMQFLIDEGADLNIFSQTMHTPLHCCCNHNDSLGMELLVKAGCMTDIRTGEKYTPLEVTTDPKMKAFLELRSRFNVLSALMESDHDNEYDVPMALINLIADFVTSV